MAQKSASDTDGAMTKVLVGAPCGKTPVCDGFYECFYALQIPEGSIRRRARGGSVPRNLNQLVAWALEEHCTHLFIVEDDSTFAPDTVLRLLAHDKPVVAGLCLARHPPFRPYVYSEFVPAEGLRFRPLCADDHGLIRVAATGVGGILIRTDVFRKLSQPYFEIKYANGQEYGQDILYGQKLIEAGIEVYCDLDVPIWHVTQCALASRRDDSGWQTVVKIADTLIEMPSDLLQAGRS